MKNMKKILNNSFNGTKLIKRFSSTFDQTIKRHVIGALVVNQPGCLAQIANLFAARGYNIDSLVVGRTEIPQISRMTVVVNATSQCASNMKRHLEDVVLVAAVDILSEAKKLTNEEEFRERDLMLAKISATNKDKRDEILQLTQLFDGKVIDINQNEIIVQCANTPSQIEKFIEMINPLGIIEVHRSGVIAMSKMKSMSHLLDNSHQDILPFEENNVSNIDISHLPPG